MAYLAGEWVTANLGFGTVFVIVLTACAVMGFLVVRSEERKRAREMAELESRAAETPTEEHH